VEAAEDGQDAIEKWKSKYFDLVLLDIELPDMEGTELLNRFEGNVPRTMKIMVTGHATLDNAVRALNLGADAYLTKPVDPEDLLRTVEEKLREQQKNEKMSKRQVTDWIQTRVKRIEAEYG